MHINYTIYIYELDDKMLVSKQMIENLWFLLHMQKGMGQ
jgi:hypothetical protein